MKRKARKRIVRRPRRTDIYEDFREDADFTRWCGRLMGHPPVHCVPYPSISSQVYEENTLLDNLPEELRNPILEQYAEVFADFEPVMDVDEPLVLEFDGDVEKQVFLACVRNGDTEEVQKLGLVFDQGLLVAVTNNDAKMVKVLAELGANFNTASVLETACNTVNVSLELIETILEHEVVGGTSLHNAIKHNRFDIVKVLVGHGVNVNEVDENNQTALEIATILEHPDTISYLISHGARL